MNLREFLGMYDNWDKVVSVNDGTLTIKGKPDVLLSHGILYEKEVVSFGIHDNELCVKVR